MVNHGKKWRRMLAFLFVIPMLLSACGEKRVDESGDEDTFIHIDITEPEQTVPAAPEPEVMSEEEPTQILKSTATVTGSGNIKLQVRTGLDPDKPMVALTFDDGPGQYTEGILDLLEEYDGRGTFCVVGNRLEKYTDQINRMVENGHEIASHTWTHTNLKKVGEEEGKKAMRSVIDYINELNGYQIRFVRPPYGGFNDTVKKEASDLGVALLRWSIDTLDWQTRNTASTVNSIKQNAKDGSIILVHDIHAETAAAMKEAIPWLAKNGFQLVTVSELLYYENDGATAGKVYYNT